MNFILLEEFQAKIYFMCHILDFFYKNDLSFLSYHILIVQIKWPENSIKLMIVVGLFV